MEQTYEIEEILDHRGKGIQKEYLVKWRGYDEATWQGIKTFDTTEYWRILKNTWRR